MEMLQGVWKQHLKPRVVVGYGVKSFLPSPPNYVTRSPGRSLQIIQQIISDISSERCFAYVYIKSTFNNEMLPCIVHDGIEPVSNCKDCAVRELSSDCLLNELISFQVHRGRGFIKNEYFTFTEQCTRQTYQLPLTNANQKEIIKVFLIKCIAPIPNQKASNVVECNAVKLFWNENVRKNDGNLGPTLK